MRETVLNKLCCPVCRGGLDWQAFQTRSPGEIEEGAAWCRPCRRWFPIEGGLLELLPPELAYRDDRQRFADKYHRELNRRGWLGTEAEGDRGTVEAQLKQQAHFDWYASNGTQSYSAYEQMPFWKAVDAATFGAWRREVKAGAWLLDVGCAQGRSAFKFLDLPVHVVGFDVSKALVRQAIDQYRAGTYAAEATFFVGDGSRLPFQPQTFDNVLIYGVLHHLPEPGETCRQVAEVLKPGGVYFGSENNQSVFRALFDLAMKVLPIWHEEAGAQPLISARQFRQWFAATPVSVTTRTEVFVLPHMVNLLGHTLGGMLLKATNFIGSWTPILCRNGGLIVVRGEHKGAALPQPTPLARSA